MIAEGWTGAEVVDPWRRDGPQTGVVVKWEPLGSAMNDALVRYADGQEFWASTHTLRPTSGPPRQTRAEAVAAAEITSRQQLLAIREGLVREVLSPRWPGCEFGKGILGMALDAALGGPTAEEHARVVAERDAALADLADVEAERDAAWDALGVGPGGTLAEAITLLARGWSDRCAALTAERDEARARIARLERVLAVERGDESQAPPGWRPNGDGCWAHNRIGPIFYAPRGARGE